MRTPLGTLIGRPAVALSVAKARPLLTFQTENPYPLLCWLAGLSGRQTLRNHPALTERRDAEKLLTQREQSQS